MAALVIRMGRGARVMGESKDWRTLVSIKHIAVPDRVGRMCVSVVGLSPFNLRAVILFRHVVKQPPLPSSIGIGWLPYAEDYRRVASSKLCFREGEYHFCLVPPGGSISVTQGM